MILRSRGLVGTARVEACSISQKWEPRDANMWRLAAIGEAPKHDKNEYFAGISDMWNLEVWVTDRPFRS